MNYFYYFLVCVNLSCLQETFLKPTGNLNIRGYTLYNHIHQARERASSGSSIVFNNSVPQSLITCKCIFTGCFC